MDDSTASGTEESSDAAHPRDHASSESRLAQARVSATRRFTSIRERSPIVDGLATAVVHDSEVGGGLMAGALAFRMFLFLVPFVLFMFTAFGTAGDIADKSPQDLASSVGISGLLAKGVVNTNSLSTGQKWTILFVSGYAMILASRSLVKALVASVCLAWKIPRQKVRSTAAGVIFIVYFTVVSLLTSGLARLRNAAPTPGIALEIAWLAIPFVSIWWLMAKLPHRNAPVWALIPGAIVTSIGFQVIHLLTVWWIAPSATSKTETYGIIGISLATLAWCYIGGRLIIGSTVLNAALWRRYEDNHSGVVLNVLEPGAKFVEQVKHAFGSLLGLFR